MIDDLLKMGNDEFDLDGMDFDQKLAALSRASSTMSQYDSSRPSVNTEDMKLIAERARVEKEESLQQFKDLMDASFQDVEKAKAAGWEDSIEEAEREKIEKARKLLKTDK